MSTRKDIGIRELKNSTSRVVDEVREHEREYVVTKRGKPVAVLRPWDATDERAARADRAREALATLNALAARVAKAAGKRTASTAVSEQRR